MAANSKEDAAKEVDARKISPSACFITFKNNKIGYKPLDGTGCAHYVAHKLNIKFGTKGISACDEGYAIKVPDLVKGMNQVKPENVAVDDVWANLGLNHCGIVTAVSMPTGKNVPDITITHCASNETAGRMGPTVSSWGKFFGGHGQFYRN